MTINLVAPSSKKTRFPLVVLNNTIGCLSLIGLFSGGIKLSLATSFSTAVPSIFLVSVSTVAALFSGLNAACWRRQRPLNQTAAKRPAIDLYIGGASASKQGAKGSRLSLYT